MMTVPKPTAPKKAHKAHTKREPVQKKEFTPQEHMTHRPFAEALKDFFKKETN
jgi:hypothetical protein